MQASSVSTVYEAFAEAADRNADRPFLHIPAVACRAYSPVSIDLTYRGMVEKVSRLAVKYRDAGYGHGHRIALMLENRPQFFEHFLALNSLGASIVPMSAELRTEEVRYLLDHSDAALVVALADHCTRVRQAIAALGTRPAVVPDDAEELPPPLREIPRDLRLSSEEAALLYTSGTTGKPKGCVLANAYFLECGRWYVNLGGLCTLTAGCERLITPLPLNHSNALAWSFLGMALSGGCLVQLDRFHPQRWWDTVRSSRATVIHYLGVMPAILLKSPPSGDEDFSRQIKFGLGAGVDPRHQAAFEQRFGFPLAEGWAMTEGGSGAITMINKAPRHVGTRCIGRPEPWLDYRLVDESDQDVPGGEPGQLLVRRRGGEPRRFFFSGYYKDPRATAEAWAGDWFHTGDVVRADADGYLYFVDRRKNIVRRSGENIAAVEVEGVLQRHAAVKGCAITPVPDEVRGEEVFAFVILDPAAVASPALARELFDFAGSLLAYFKLPGYIAFVEALPLTGSQKIQRGEIRRLAEQYLTEVKAFDMTPLKKRSRFGGTRQERANG